MTEVNNSNDLVPKDFLPREIWMQVFEYCELGTLWKIRQVCYIWRRLSHRIYENASLASSIPILFEGNCIRNTPVANLRTQEFNENKMSFRSTADSKHGFFGLGIMIVNLMRKIKDDWDHAQSTDVLFRRESFMELTSFLKDAWESIRESVPRALEGAYATLFNHIYRTFVGVCNRPTISMAADLQIALLAQTWRVVDVLSPGLARDMRICSNFGCCNGRMRFGNPLIRSSFKSINVFEDVQPDANVIDYKKEILSPEEAGLIEISTFTVALVPGNTKNVAIITCLSHGDDNEHMTMIDFAIECTPLWLANCSLLEAQPENRKNTGEKLPPLPS